MLEVIDLSRRYGDVVALDHLSFTVEPGQLFGFVGPNGAGKTTTMRIILGVLEPDGGEVRWRGRPVDLDTRARFGYMPEERGLYPKMRVLDQLAYFASLHGLPRAAASAAAEGWLERLGMADRAGDRVESLSLGNQQRVQLGVALVHGPELLVLDEPFSGLDPVGVDVLSGVLQGLADEGVPVVFSSHQLELVERLCESVAIVKDGRLVASGRVEELRERGTSGPTVRVAVARGRRGLAGKRARAPRSSTAPRRAARRAARRRRARRAAGRRALGRERHPFRARAADAERALPQGGGGMSGLRGRPAIALVARREITQRIREKSFLISMAVTIVLVVGVAVVPPLFGFGGKQTFTVAVADGGSLAVAQAADRGAKAFDADIKVRRLSAEDPDAALRTARSTSCCRTRGLQAQEEPDETLLGTRSRPPAARCGQAGRSGARG